MSKEQLTAHQQTLLSMMIDFDNVCRKHNIKYTLFAGTALGAVREGGFIPWDDDVDVILLREDYERFFNECADDFDKEKYYVQKEFTSHWPMNFSKLRLNNTACIEKYHAKDRQMHQGVYIDIFPCDNLSENSLVRRMQFLCSKVVIAKSLYRRGYETDSKFKKMFMLLCRALPMKPFYNFCVRKKNKNSKSVHSFLGAGKAFSKNIFPREWFTDTVEISFENHLFPISKQYDKLLTSLYGDYMTPPDEKDRKCKEHAAIVDLEHSYTDYLDIQAQMTFDEHTISIR